MISTPFSLSQPSTSASDRPGLILCRDFHTIARLEGSLELVQARPVPGGPLTTSSKTCSQSANTRRWVSRLLALASLAPDTRA